MYKQQTPADNLSVNIIYKYLMKPREKYLKSTTNKLTINVNS